MDPYICDYHKNTANFVMGSLGRCRNCGGGISSCSNRLCDSCSFKLKSCYICGKPATNIYKDPYG